ncbi:MAG: Fe-S cluster assembly protein SufD [Lysobacterales bacterium]|jgi:Fe-S cluster assembly protein SufD
MSDFAQRIFEELPLTTGESRLNRLREEGRIQFKTLGLPDKRVEEWKYTSLLALEQRKALPGADVADGKVTFMPEPMADIAVQLSLVNGDLSDISGEPVDGVRIQSLHSALEESPESIFPMLESLEIAKRGQGFSALNNATLGPGVVIHVAANVDAGELLLQWNCSDQVEQTLLNSRVLLILEDGAKLHLIEQFENRSEDTSIFNVVVQSKLGTEAELVHTRFQHQSASSILINRTEVSQADSSRLHFTALDLGSGLTRHDVKSKLQGTGASCHLNGACVGSGHSHVDHHLYADHVAGDCQSSQLFRAVAMDRSRIVFNGKVHVFKGADGSEAKQSSAGLLLSKLAEIDAKPELEIYADEVIANHGATVGQLDDKALFYLQSRGLNLVQATNLLTMAFCRSVTDQLPSIVLREVLGERLSSALNGVVDNV